MLHNQALYSHLTLPPVLRKQHWRTLGHPTRNISVKMSTALSLFFLSGGIFPGVPIKSLGAESAYSPGLNQKPSSQEFERATRPSVQWKGLKAQPEAGWDFQGTLGGWDP